jgi:hypothetical protein
VKISCGPGTTELGKACLDGSHEQLVATIRFSPGHRRIPQPRRISHSMLHHVFYRWIGRGVVDIELRSVYWNAGDDVFSGETNEGLFMGRQEVDRHIGKKSCEESIGGGGK